MNQPQRGDGLNCSLRNPQLANLRALAGSKQTFPQRPPQAVQVRQGVPGFQTPHPFPHNSSSSPMACLFHNFQVSLPESVSVSNTQTCARSGTTSLPETSGRKSLPQFEEGPHKAQAQSVGPAGAEGLPGGCVGGESVDAIYRAVVDAASKGVQVVITTTVSGTTQARPVPSLSSMSAFTASQGGPCGLPQSVSSVIHGHRKPRLQEADARPIQPRMSCPRQSSEQGKSTHDGGQARGYFRSPGAQKRQWEGDATPGADCHPLLWRGEEFLECSAHVRSSPCKEGLRGLASSLPRPSEHQHNPLLPGDKVFLEDGFRFGNCQRVAGGGIKERLEQVAERCAHMNGGGPLLPGRGYVDTLGPPRHDLMSEDQSPSSSSTSLEGSLSKDYAHYNGHYNGCAPSPSDTKSLSSEEDLRHPDSPSSNELLHFRPRAFPMGELVWGPIKRFSPWHSKMAGEEQVHHPSLQNSEHGKVDPGKLKTLTEDLEAFNRAAKRNIKGGNLNNHLEAAIHVTMSELDKMSGNVHQVPPRDRQVKPPKSKRRKISR
ncbi:hypothetical protein AGOR_G00214750 [Albula goreensis]|uniref:Uncharacterized protein n=1 Tax=Albula goreensis TaxID=1534307 RepID=A0A8T3CIJ2_9TELE|nr:hypothetical protein AGOR_G00214750 [Albula goreensis]